MTRKPYPTDRTDAQWAALEPLLPKPKSGTPRGGRPAADTREVRNAIWYLLRTGTAWRLLPHDCPPWQTAYTRFRVWRLAGVWGQVRTAAGRLPTPDTLRVDSQTVKTAPGGPRGWDGGKRGSRPQAVRGGGLARAGLVAGGDGGQRAGPGQRVVAAGRGAAAAVGA